MLSKFQIFKIGFFDVAPHLLSVIPFGIIFGAIGIELGFDPIMTYATSLIIFGGASQIVFLQLLSGGASSLIAITSVGVINSRHFLYGAVLSEYLQKLSLIKKLFISYFIVDQGFAVSNQYFKKKPNEEFKHYHLIGSGITLWFIWQVSTIMGIYLGSIVPEELGLKFAIPLTFIAIIINELRKIDHLIVMIVSGLSATFFYNAPFKTYIIISPLIGLFAAIIINKLKK
jgi:predicted branched-subunit amino acid permease